MDLETAAFKSVDETKQADALAMVEGKRYTDWKQSYSGAVNDFLRLSAFRVQRWRDDLARATSLARALLLIACSIALALRPPDKSKRKGSSKCRAPLCTRTASRVTPQG